MKTLLRAAALGLLLTAAMPVLATPPAKAAAAVSQPGVLIDVRTAEEYASGHLQGALLLPVDRIAQEIAARVPDKHTPIRLYCRSGRRSALALEALQQLGYTRLQNLGGLEEASHSSQLPIVK